MKRMLLACVYELYICHTGIAIGRDLMKKFFALCLILFYCFVYINIVSAAEPPPETIIEHNKISGEVSIEKILKSYLISKNDQLIYLYPFTDSPVVGNIHNGEVLNTISVEMHSNPQNGKTLVTSFPSDVWGMSLESFNLGKSIPVKGDYIYLIYYGGEGTYLAWYNNNIIRVSENGINNRPYRSSSGEKIWAEYKGIDNLLSEVWICVKKISGIEGWVKFESTDDWVNTSVGGIFLNKDSVEKSINSRYQ